MDFFLPDICVAKQASHIPFPKPPSRASLTSQPQASENVRTSGKKTLRQGMSFWSGKPGLICACEITSEMLISTRQAVRCQMIARTAPAQGEYHLWVLRREGRTLSVTLSHCWLQWFRHTTSNGNHMPIYLLQSLNMMQRLCQGSLEVAKKKKKNSSMDSTCQSKIIGGVPHCYV